MLLQQCNAQGVFLQQQLPLKVTVTTPTALVEFNDSTPVTLTERQAITAVFSRPVIALGSDWGKQQLPSFLVPFTLSCNVPGRLRWVTTNIARFDPVIEWPTDLDCTFNWNKDLKTFDGAPLVLGDMKPSVRLITRPLTVDVSSVASKAASDATDDQWSATLGLPEDQQPEVPPDANITLSFSYPVELSKLAAALQVAGRDAGSRTVTVSPCTTIAPLEFWPLVFSASRAVPANAPAGAETLNSTCAVVKIVPGLAAGGAAVLRLPKGSQYSSVAGAVQADTDVKVFGLRPFRIPLSRDFMNVTDINQNIYSGVKYRRLTMWLPHGLAPDTQLSSIRPLIQICSVVNPFAQGGVNVCRPERFELSRPTKGTLVMAVPALAPRQQYRVAITADASVKDAFGLPLQSSNNSWWTMDLDTAFQGPNINQVALLEALDGTSSLHWPWVSRGKADEGVDKVQAWELNPNSNSNSDLLRAVAAINYGFSGIEAAAFGTPDASISRSSSPNPSFQQLKLPIKTGISFVGGCCRPVTWPKPRKVLSSNLVVTQSNLQAAFIQQGPRLVAWITTTQGASSPVEGAKVQLYYTQYGTDLALLGPSCVTETIGSCAINYTSAIFSNAGGNAGSLVALVTAQGQGPLLVPGVPSYNSNTGLGKYVGSVVLDRALVKPGDSLHITAFIQERSGAELKIPSNLGKVLLQIIPSFDPAASSGATTLVVPVNATYGTSHAVISVPASAPPANYQLNLYTVGSTGGASNGQPIPLDVPLDAFSGGVYPISTSVISDGVVPPKLPAQPAEAPGSFINSTSFTVADPRPPTAALTLKAPAWVLPNDPVLVTVQAESYIGSDVSGANVTVQWNTPRAQGTLDLTTNANGIATGTIDLGKLSAGNASQVGDQLTLQATWIGPTREPIMQSQTVKIADGALRVELTRSLSTDVPGILFGVMANVYSNEDDTPVDGVTVEVSISPANSSTSLLNCTAADVALLKEQTCTIKSNDINGAVSCQLQLPCPGEFELKGCVSATGGSGKGGNCGQPLKIGRNATWWQLAPWTTAPETVLLANKKVAKIGDGLTFVLQNPWWGPTSAMLVWGNKITTMQAMVPNIPAGPSLITIPQIGEECRGKCNLAVIMAVARPNITTDRSSSSSSRRRLTSASAANRGSVSAIFIPSNWIRPVSDIVQSVIARFKPGVNATGRAGSGDQPASSQQQQQQQAAVQSALPLPLPDIPISKLFDPYAPRTITAQLSLEGETAVPLVVDVAVSGQAKAENGTAVIAPQSGKGTIQVVVRDSEGRPVPNAEVTLVVVDKAVLDLKPYDLQNVTTAVAPDLAEPIAVADLNPLRVSQSAINATFTALERRLLQIDPWLPADTTVQPNSFYPIGNYFAQPQPAAVDVPDARYIAAYTTAITPLPSAPCLFGGICPLPVSFASAVGMMADAVAMPMAAATSAPAPGPQQFGGNGAQAEALTRSFAGPLAKSAPAGAPGAASTSVRLQGDFRVTPLFTVTTTASNGVASAAFTAPDNLGRFVVRAYVAAPTPPGIKTAAVAVLYGADETELIVRRTVSLTPSLPRQVRAGDNFTAGVVVDAPGTSSAIQVTVTAALVMPASNSSTPGAAASQLALNGPSSVTVALSPGKTQAEARFSFRARSIGLQAIAFSAVAGEGAVADQVQLQVPVLGKQSPVWLATSFAVRGSNNSEVANRVEGLAMPDAENGTGYIGFVAGVGYLPAIQGAYETLVRQDGLTTSAAKACPSGSATVALSVMPVMLSLYRPAGAAASSLLTAFQLNTTLRAMNSAATLLTDATYGLLAVDLGCLFPGNTDPRRADISLNAWATWLVQQLSPLVPRQPSASTSLDQAFISRWAGLDATSKTWRNALESQLVADAAAARKAQPPRAYDDLETLSWARLVLGPDWKPSSVSDEVVQDLSLQRLTAAAVNMSIGGQARVGLVLLQQSGGTTTDPISKIVKRLLSAVRVGGRTAYVATGEGARGAAALSDQALALVLFLRSGTDNPLIQKVAAWISQGAAPPPLVAFGAVSVSSNPWESGLRSLSLSAYDNGTESTTPDLRVKALAQNPKTAANSQPVELLSARFNSSNAGNISRQMNKWEQIPPGANLFFTAKGRGEVSVAVSLNFTPAQLLPFPTYRGLWVQRIVQLASAEGGSIQGVGLGRLVTVAVQVTSPDDQSDVIVEVLMPGGLEPLDPNVFKEPDVATTCRSSDDESDLSSPSAPSFKPVPRMVPMPTISVSFAPDNQFGSRSPYQTSAWWLPWPVCPVQTTTPATVSFKFDYFRAGTQTIRFKAVSATTGVFALPPVKAYVQQQPEVMGLSPAGLFTVCPTAADCPAAQQLLPASPAAKACPGDCSGSGACNLALGQCICDAGFSGPSCAVFTSTR
eukprot:gene9083-9253_t